VKPIKFTPEIMAAYPWRFKFALVLLSLLFLVMGWRVVDLQIFDHEFLNTQGDARALRTEEISAHRGMIRDRNGLPLAVSTPVSAIWINPQKVEDPGAAAARLSGALGISPALLKQRLEKHKNREFIYLKRRIPPAQADNILALKVAGVGKKNEYRRYYPAAEVTAHLVGFTDIDDQGQEGVELAYDSWLKGVAGAKLVLKDRYGRIIRDLQPLREEKRGKDIYLSIDLRLQYLAYRELKAAVNKYRAKAGSLVLLDAASGEVLALVNQPSYNPNNRGTINHANLRNRAMTDVFEPGSTMKPFTVAAALESGEFSTTSRVDTAPGYLRLGRHTIRDHRNYGEINLTTLLSKSSNVGASKIALALDEEVLWNLFSQLGLGQATGSGFPGERAGILPYRERWRDVEIATLSYGYGLSVTAIQLAQAYTSLANRGRLKPVSLLGSNEEKGGVAVISSEAADRVLTMLERVVDSGTGTRAQVENYRVAGKTGTVHKLGEKGYQQDKYLAVFAGVAPVEQPRLVAVVLIDEPSGREYYGGEVAAPVFSRVISGALRLLNVPPAKIAADNQSVLLSNNAGASKADDPQYAGRQG